MSPYLLILYVFAVTLLVSAMLVFTQHWHGHFSMDSTDGVQKQHIHPTPRIGGVAIVMGLSAAWALAGPDVRAILGPMLLAGIPAFASGLLEDITKKVGVLPRLLATMISGALAWYLTGVAMQNTGVPPLDWLLSFTPVAVLFTAFAVGGVANSVNIIDGFNGLAAGSVTIMLAALGLISLNVGDAPLATICFLFSAVALGFGAVNWPMGKIFLGDGGAYLLGFLVAWIAVLLPMRSPHVNASTTLLVCAYPVIEVVYSMVRRQRQRKSSGAPDSLHMHSLVKTQVIRKKFPHLHATYRNSAVSPLMWCYAALPAGLGVAFYDQSPLWLALGLLACVVVYHRIYKRLALQRIRDTLKARRTVKRKSATAQFVSISPK